MVWTINGGSTVTNNKNKTLSLLLAFGLMTTMLLTSLAPLIQKAQATPSDIFTSSFEDNNFSEWDSAESNWDTVSGNASNGNYRADASGAASGDLHLVKTIDTTGYDSVSMSYDYKMNGMDEGDIAKVQYSIDGSTWIDTSAVHNGVSGETDDDTTWRSGVTSLPVGHTTLSFRFYIVMDSPSADEFQLDKVMVLGEATPAATATAVTNMRNNKVFDGLAEALNDSDTQDNDILRLNEDLVITQQVTITRPITIDGGGYEIDAAFVKTSNSNNSALGVQSDGVTIRDIELTSSADQPYPQQLHGINVFESTNVDVTGATVYGFQGTGIAYNSSTGTIENVHTENNGWHGINIDKNSSNVNVIGTNTHNEPFADIYVDNDTLNVTVNAPAYYWERSGITGRENDRVYRLSPTVEPCNDDSGFDTGFVDGSVDGQNGWESTGPYDQEIVANEYGITSYGCKALRLSNAVTSNGFGDHTFTHSTPNEAGEADSTSNGKSGGTRQDVFEAQFDIATTKNEVQPGLALSISPDRGDGSRMSYLSFSDTSDGIATTFYDVTGNSSPVNFSPTALPTLSRTEPHTIKFKIDYNDGPSNDVVEIYIDGNLVHTGTTWENYYRYDSEANAEQSPRTTDSLLFRAAGNAVPANSGEGFLFDNVLLSTYSSDSEAPSFSIENPANGTAVRETIDIRARITDESGINKVLMTVPTKSGNKTYVYENGKPNNSLVKDGDIYYTTIDTNTMNDGVTHVVLRGTDNAGNTRYWNNNANNRQHSFIVDNKAPVISNVRVGNPVSGLAEIRVDLMDPSGINLTGSKTHVRFFRGVSNDGANTQSNNTAFTYDSINDDYVATIDTTAFANDASGTYWVYVRAEDNIGNAAGNNDTRGIVVDNTDPTITVKDSSTGNRIEGVFTNVSFKLYDKHKIDKVTINGVEKNLSDNQWSDVNGVKPGVFGAIEGKNELIVFDVAGNTSGYQFNLDTIAPDVTITSPVDGAVVDGMVNVSGEVVDANPMNSFFRIAGPNGYSKTSLFQDGRSIHNMTWDTDGLASGEYTIRFEARDLAGNKNNGSITEIKVIVDNTKPAANVISPASGDVLNTSSFTVTGTARDTDTGILEVKYTVTQIDSIGGSYQANVADGSATYNPISETWEFDVNTLTDGFYRLKVQAFDVAGNFKYDYNDIQIDTTAPAVAITSIDQNGDGTYTILGTSDDASPVTVTIKNSGDDGNVVPVNGSWSYISSVLSPGDYIVTAASTDAAGNSTDPETTQPFSVPVPTETQPGGTGGGDGDTGNEQQTSTNIEGGNTTTAFAPTNFATNEPQVLGLAANNANENQAIDNEDDTSGDVLGSATAPQVSQNLAAATSCSKLIGICWYYWIPVVLAVLGLGYFAYVRRNVQD